MSFSQILLAAAAGAGAMYLLDPNQGKSRRAQIRDRAQHEFAQGQIAVDKGIRDLSNRTEGLFAETRDLFNKAEAVSDDILVERIRSRMGRWIGQTRSIEVLARDGEITLRGPISAPDAQQLVRGVMAMRGMRALKNELDIHAGPSTLPVMPSGYWPPAMRLLAGATGGGMTLLGMRRGAANRVALALGISLLTRALQQRS